MGVLFVHDHKFFRHQDNYYSTGGLSGATLARYVDLFGDVTVLARSRDLETLSAHLSLSSIPSVRFLQPSQVEGLPRSLIAAYQA